jgi:putative transposase
MSRQNYYAARRTRARAAIDSCLAVELVKMERELHPRLGARKLHFMLSPILAENGVSIGRDRFFDILRDADLLVPPLPRSPRSTDSRHNLPIYRNLLKDMQLAGPGQALVADITYIRTDEGFLYVALIMDGWSRKIVGWHASDSLEAEGCRLALEMALGEYPDAKDIVHHSDRGCQYASHVFADFCRKHGVRISMTEELHCYENAKAERLNGILKQEYGMDASFRTKSLAKKALGQSIWLYNEKRPHQMLGYKTPSQSHTDAA